QCTGPQQGEEVEEVGEEEVEEVGEVEGAMAEPSSPDYFSCPLCVGLLRDPVAIPCGHSFCMDCISGYWNEADYTGIYICPQCKITFTQRPVLRPNATLTLVAEKIKKSGLNLNNGNAHHQHHHQATGNKLLGVSQAEIKQKCQERMKELDELRTAVDSLKSSAQRAMVESQKMFEEMIRSIERMRTENFNYLCTPTDDGFIPRVTVNPDFSFATARKAVPVYTQIPSYTTESLQSRNDRTIDRRSRGKEIITVDSAPPPEPKTRADFLKYFCQLRLDSNTAYRELHLSDSNKKVIRTRDLQP
ncbi:hypothetical protein CRUP_005514, partial [Coryphaenoides rupestris]